MSNQDSAGPRNVDNIEMCITQLVNHLNDQVYIRDQEIIRLRRTPAPMPSDDQQLADVRNKNTELEQINRGLRRDLEGTIAAFRLEQRDHQLLREAFEVLEFANKKLDNLEKLPEITPTGPMHELDTYALHMADWCRQTFGSDSLHNPIERAMRLVEETIKVAQCCGVTTNQISNIHNMVYSKPVGSLMQELGGVIVCWAILVHSVGFNPSDIMDRARDDCWKRRDVIREKHRLKVMNGTSVIPETPVAMHDMRADLESGLYNPTPPGQIDGDRVIRESQQAHEDYVNHLNRVA